MFLRLRYLLPFLVFGLAASSQAVLVDWSAQTWTPGSLSNSFDVDPANAGNDVTVTVAGDTGQLQPSLQSPNPMTPTISTAMDGGFSPAHPTLELAMDLANNTQGLTVTINFSALYAQGVSNVSFALFDIDMQNVSGSTYQDQIRNIVATTTTGDTIAATISGLGSSVTLDGLGTAQTLTGTGDNTDHEPNSANGNAVITFLSDNISSITFTYGTTSLFTDPTYEHIALDNVNYSVIPEVSPKWLWLLFAGIVAAPTIFRSWEKRNSFR